MRIGFDASPLQRGFASPGVERATRGLIEALHGRARAGASKIDWVELSPAEGTSPRVWRQISIPRLMREHNLAGFHSSVSAVPLTGRFPVVQTVHEVPWQHAVPEGSSRGSRLWLRAGVRRAGAVLTPSQRTADDHRSLTPNSSIQRVVAPWGLGPEFLSAPPPGPSYPASPGPAVRLLIPGGTRPKKNAELLIRALARPAGQDLELLITGARTQTLDRCLALAAQLGVAGRLHYSEHMTEPNWLAEIDRCLAVCAISASEGYGFPALEALARGRPALISPEIPSVEAAGELALRIDPSSESQLDAALANCRQAGEKHARAARAFAREHTTARCAERVESLWIQLLEPGSPPNSES